MSTRFVSADRTVRQARPGSLIFSWCLGKLMKGPRLYSDRWEMVSQVIYGMTETLQGNWGSVSAPDNVVHKARPEFLRDATRSEKRPDIPSIFCCICHRSRGKLNLTPDKYPTVDRCPWFSPPCPSSLYFNPLWIEFSPFSITDIFILNRVRF